MVQYFVFSRANAWWISLEGRDYGPYGSRQEATDAAVGSAEVCVEEGASARVVAEGRLGGFLTLWDRSADAPAEPRQAA